jgi:CBS domain-containing protein
MTIAAILKHKGRDVAGVPATKAISEVVHELTVRNIGAVIVHDGAALLGILSERDIIRALAEHGPRALEMAAGELMTHAVQTTTTKTTVDEALNIMTAGRFRHLPVVEKGELIGIVSIGDVVKARISQQDQEVDSLKAYVAGAA